MQRNADGAPLRSSMRRFVLLVLLAFVSTSIALGARAAELTFDLRVEDGRVPESMRLIRVKQGDVVTLQWTVDRPLLLHLHGYDIRMAGAARHRRQGELHRTLDRKVSGPRP
jgi:hypothetical protein